MWVIVIAGVIAAAAVYGPQAADWIERHANGTTATSTPEVRYDEAYKRDWKAKRAQDADFKQTVDDELEKQYYSTLKEEVDAKLRELEDKGFKGEQVSVLKDYLRATNPELVTYADEIVDLPRWIDVVGIIGQETTFCTKGVGSSKNNCGAIKGRDGEFIAYANEYEGIKAVAMLLEKPVYKGKSLATINGTYCQDESKPGRKCDGWHQNVDHIASTLRSRINNS